MRRIGDDKGQQEKGSGFAKCLSLKRLPWNLEERGEDESVLQCDEIYGIEKTRKNESERNPGEGDKKEKT